MDTCYITGSGGFNNCRIAPASQGYPFYRVFQIKAADGTPSTPYTWDHVGSSGSKGGGDFSWGPVQNVYPGYWLNVDNNWCDCGTSGTYRVNWILKSV